MAKRSRRERRLGTDKQKQVTPKAAQAKLPAAEIETSAITAEEFTPAPAKTTPAAPANHRKTVNFTQEYFYVYTELRNILIITVLMFVVMAGLSFVI